MPQINVPNSDEDGNDFNVGVSDGDDTLVEARGQTEGRTIMRVNGGGLLNRNLNDNFGNY